MKQICFFVFCIVLICGCSKEYHGDVSNISRITTYGGWRSRATNLRLKMIMNHLGIKEDDFIIHEIGSATEYNDVVHKKAEFCDICKGTLTEETKNDIR